MVAVDKFTAKREKVFIHKRRQARRRRQVGDVTVAHRAVPALPGRVFIAEIVRQAVTQALLCREQIQHGVNSRHLRHCRTTATSVNYR